MLHSGVRNDCASVQLVRGRTDSLSWTVRSRPMLQRGATAASSRAIQIECCVRASQSASDGASPVGDSFITPRRIALHCIDECFPLPLPPSPPLLPSALCGQGARAVGGSHQAESLHVPHAGAIAGRATHRVAPALDGTAAQQQQLFGAGVHVGRDQSANSFRSERELVAARKTDTKVSC